jgi:hypothetical protein
MDSAEDVLLRIQKDQANVMGIGVQRNDIHGRPDDAIETPRSVPPVPFSLLRVWLFVALALLFASANAWLHWNSSGLNYDEGDYYQATAKGFWTNWTDADEIPITEFVSQGLKAVRGEISRGELSRQARERRTVVFLRHYHPPLAFYPGTVVHAVASGLTEEAQMRAINIVWMVLWIISIGLLMTFWPQLRQPWFIVLPASASWAAATVGFNMHILFGLAVSTFALLWYAYEKDRSARGLKRTALFFLAVALCSVEYSLYLIIALGCWELKSLWISGRGMRMPRLRGRLRDAGWLVGFMLLLWPAGILKLGLPKAYAFTSFIALFRLHKESSVFDSLWHMLVMKWNPSPLELVLAAAALLAVVWRWRDVWNRGSLFATVLLALAIMYTQLNPMLNLPWYLFPFFAIIYNFYFHVLAERVQSIRRHEGMVAVGVAVALFGVAQLAIRPGHDPQMRALRDAVASLPETRIVSVQILTPQLSAYFPERRVQGIQSEEFANPQILDSLAIWRHDRILVLPKEIPMDGRKVIETEGFAVYAPGR